MSEQYLAAKKRRPNTVKAVERYFTTHWASLRNTPIGDIKRPEVAALLQEMIKANGVSRRRGPGRISRRYSHGQ